MKNKMVGATQGIREKVEVLEWFRRCRRRVVGGGS